MRTLVFDLDDTLYPEREFVLSGFRAVGEWMWCRFQVSDFANRAQVSFEAGNRGRIFNDVLAELRIECDEALIGKMLRVYRIYLPQLRLYPDAAWALDHFVARLPLGLITDGHLQSQRNKIAALGISRYFKAIVCSDEFGRESWKPSAVPYEKICEVIGGEHGQCIYVADNPTKDFITARKLGWHCVQVVRSGNEYGSLQVPEDYQAHRRVRSLVELPGMLS